MTKIRLFVESSHDTVISFRLNMENAPNQPSTSKKRQRKKPKKERHQATSSADEDTPERVKTAKKRKISKSSQSTPPQVEDPLREAGTVKMAKTKRRLEQMLKEAEEIEAKTKEVVETIEVEETGNDREILLGVPWKVDVHTHNDLISTVMDEISLEGLDGITLEALWLRLSVIMSSKVPEFYRDNVWKVIEGSDKLDFFELPEPRGKLVIFNRFQHVDVASGHLMDIEDVPEDIYPFAPLSDEKAAQLDVYGSCSTFDVRLRVTDKIRNLRLNEAERIGNKLVIVADQSLRNECLGLNETKSLTKLFNQQYSLLERIGRSRRLGESSAGKTSLRQFADSKVMFYLRKVLVKNDLITKQQLCFKNRASCGHISGLLFHLKRFYFHYKTKKRLVIEQIVEILKKKPNFKMEYMELKRVFGPDMWQNAVVKMLKGNELKQFVNTNIPVAYREIYPNAPKEEWMSKNKKEKTLRVLQLIDPNVNVANALKEVTKEEVQKDDSSDDEPLCESAFNKSIYDQIYNVIFESGTEGLTQSQITLKLGLDTYVSRTAIKSLERESLIYYTNADLGCYRVLKYFAVSYQKRNSQKTSVINEETSEETLDFISDVLNVDKKYLKPSNNDVPMKTDSENPSATNSLKGEYGFIKEYRKKCRQDKYNTRFRGEFYKVENLDGDKQKMEEILRNEHEFFDMRESTDKGVIKRLDFRIDLGEGIRFEDDENAGKNGGFDLFTESYKVPKAKPAVDYNSMQLQVRNFFHRNNRMAREIFIDKPGNSGSTKILIEYFKIYSSPSIGALLEKFDELVNSIVEQKSNKTIQYPKALDNSDGEDNLEIFDGVSLTQNFENEEFVRNEMSEDIRNFKDDLINKFEEEHSGINKLFWDPQSEDGGNRIDDLKDIEVVEPDDGAVNKETILRDIFGGNDPDSWKEFDRNHFNTLVQDFQIEAFFGETVLVNYLALDKDEIETIVIFSKKWIASFEIGARYINRNMAKRALDRANYILEILYKDKVVSDVFRILNNLKKDELERGLIGTIDKKSMNRLLEKLVSEGYLMTMKVVLRHKKSTRTKHIISLPNADYQPILTAVKEQMKMSFFIYSRRKNASSDAKKQEKGEDVETISSTKMQEIEVDVYGTPKFRRNTFIGKCYGYLPKNSRHRVLHEFLFYLVYGYDGALIEKGDLPKYMEEGNLEEYPLYQREISWKMFIPPLSEYKNYPAGWILYCDALLRMPISIFTKIYNVAYVMPELVQILNDPIKKYLLLQHVQPKIRNACFFRRKYIFSIYESLQHLCYQGLLQFGEQTIRTKDQQFLYLNGRAIIYDTSSSNPGYHQTTQKDYPKLRFEFRTEEDVEGYWNRVWNICFKTRLGVRYSLLNQTITLQNIHGIPEMIEAVQPKSREAAIQSDVGYIPGDGRGACGFDSNSWMFIKRNWVGNSALKDSGKFDISASRPIGVRKKQLDKVKMKGIKLKDLHKDVLRKKKRKKIGTEAINNAQSGEQSAQNVDKVKKHNRKKPFTRKIHPRPLTRKVKRVDEIDRSIKKSALFMRSTFSQIEDNMLTIISYAIRYLFPAYKKRLLSFIVIRDLMHRLCPKCSKKTSTAYNTRLRKFCRYLNAPDTEATAVSLEADHFVQKHFSKFKERIMVGESIPQEHLHISLIYLVAYCVDSFEKNATTNKKILDEVGYVDHLESDVFNDRDKKSEIKISLYQDPTSKEEALIDTVKAVIHSSIGFEVDNTIRALHDHLDRVYQTYSEEVLRKSVLSLREHNLIKTPIVHSRKTKKTKSGNILQNSYMYSYKQITKFHENIYVEAYSVFEALKSSEGTNRFNTSTYQEGFGLGLSEVQALTTVDVTMQIPDKQFILDPNIQSHDYLIRELTARYERLVSRKATDQDIVGEAKDNQEKSEIFDKDDNTLNDLEELSKCIREGDFAKVNTKMSDLAFLLTKGLFPELEDEDDRLERFSRHFLTMLPETGFKVDRRSAKRALFEELHQTDGMESVKEAIRRDCILLNFEMSADEIKKSFSEIGAHVNDAEVALQLLAFVESKDVLGATAKELKGYFANSYGVLSLETIVERFIQLGAVLRFGVKSFRFVHFRFKDIWTVDCLREEESKPGVKLKPVPWLKINGEVNDKALLDWLFAIQSYCISNPVATFPSLCKRFNFLKPVDIYALLEHLQLLNCLKLKCFGHVEEVSMFSEPTEVHYRKSCSLDDLDNVFVETDKLAVIELGAYSCSSQALLSPFEE